MYIIIVGASRIGIALAKELIKDRHNVVIVEQDEDKAKRIAETLDAMVVNGSGTDADVLEEAGAKKADVIVAATSNDAVNLMVCELGSMLGIKRRFALYTNPKHEKIFRKVGVEEIINPSDVISRYLKDLIVMPGISILSSIKDVEIIELTISEDSDVADTEIKEIGMPEGSTIAAIYRNGELIIPKGSTVLKVGDRLTILAKKDVVKEVVNIFR